MKMNDMFLVWIDILIFIICLVYNQTEKFENNEITNVDTLNTFSISFDIMSRWMCYVRVKPWMYNL